MPTHYLPLLLMGTLLGRGKLHFPLSASPGVGPGWLIFTGSVVVPPKGLGEEAEDKPIKAHPEQRGNSTHSVSSSFHTGGRWWLALW